MLTLFFCTWPYPWGDIASPNLPVDVNHDCKIGVGDLVMILEEWGECTHTIVWEGKEYPCCLTDINRDGVTGVADLIEVLNYWGMEDHE